MSFMNFLKNYKLTVISFLGTFFIFAVIIQVLIHKEKIQLKHTIELDGKLIVDHVKLKLKENEKALIRMINRVKLYQGKYTEKEWMFDAKNVKNDLYGAMGLRKIDKEHNIVWVYPSLQKGKQLKGFSLMQEKYRKNAVIRSMKTKKITASHSIDLKVGGKGFILLAPIYYKDSFEGHFTIAYRINTMFNSILNTIDRRDFIIQILEDGKVIYDSSSSKNYLKESEYSKTYDFKDIGYSWQIKLIPTQEYLFVRKDNMNLQIGLGILSSFFVGVIFYLLQLRREKEQISLQLERTNASLEETVEEKTRYLQEVLRETEELNDDLQESNHLLAREQALYNVVYNNSLDGISIFSLKENSFVDCNRKLLEMLNVDSKKDVYDKSPKDFSPEFQPDGEKSFSKIKRMIQTTIENGSNFFEWKHKKLDGQEFWTEISLIYIKLVDEELIYTIWRDIDGRKKSEEQIEEKNIQLEEFNHTLEKRVKEKTKELEDNYQNLKNAQAQLIQSEKMASLGSLVAGVAHEINTPIGIALTASTYAIKELETLKKSYKSETMSEEEFLSYLEDTKTANDSIHKNLNKAVELIKSFKQVAVDQTSDELREFGLKKYMEEILLSLHNQIKKTRTTVKIDIDSKLTIKSNPGAFSQIFTNLIINSIIHGFRNGKEEGNITIFASLEDTKLKIIYDDNGKGVDQETQKKIFDPFYTTNRSQGGSGLGMNIVYNLVTKKLNGSIVIEEKKEKGIRFVIDIKV